MKLLPTLTKETANFSIVYNDQTVNFSAKRNAVTPMLAKRFVDVEKDPMQMAYALSEILESWDIEDVDCHNPDQLGRLPIDFISVIIEKLGETFSGNAPKPSHLQSGSAA